MGWLTNYPGLTPKTLRRNKPHSPATGLGHITASRSNVRSTRPVQDPLPSSSPHFVSLAQAQPPDNSPLEHLDHYDLTDLPDIILRCSLQPSSEFRRDAIYSDLPGAFPVRAKDGTQYLLLSVYKGYIHVEPLASRTTPTYVPPTYPPTNSFAISDTSLKSRSLTTKNLPLCWTSLPLSSSPITLSLPKTTAPTTPNAPSRPSNATS